ncbi:hypothetical protein GCM10022278_37980 [Allohahella marinimesophila]|uniref:Uncharacterized protein n=1 Tax=Allohahella marinimesophila TaxID=1054972 RepID=A0ABP7Q799_9GAMM
MNTYMLKTYLHVFTLAIGANFVLLVALSAPVYFLWNYLMPNIFGLPEISYLEAFVVA